MTNSAVNFSPVFRVQQFNGVIQIYLRPTLGAMVTKIWEFLHKLGITWLVSYWRYVSDTCRKPGF